jgi:hypothetical protein
VDAAHLAGTNRGARGLLVHQRAVTGQAGFLEDAAALLLDHDRLMKILESESLRMVIAVFRLGDVLADEAVGEVAIDAGGDGVVARLLPGIVLRLHDVAVRAHLGFVAHVREALGVEERVAADARQEAEHDGQSHDRPPDPMLFSRSHARLRPLVANLIGAYAGSSDFAMGP